MSDRLRVITPAATKNLFKNPSFELTTDNWDVIGGATNLLTRSFVQQYKGAYSLLSTYGDSSTAVITNPFITLTASTQYYASFHIWVPTGWDGGNLTVSFTSFTSSTTDSTTIWTSGTDINDDWVRIHTVETLDSDTTGFVSIIASGTPSGSKFIYIDAAQLEETQLTTYADGDLGVGFSWVTEPHNGFSKRESWSKAGGTTKLFDTDLSFLVDGIPGAGKSPVSNSLVPLTQGGTIYQRTVNSDRVMTILGSISGSTLNLLHDLRQAIMNEFSADDVSPQNKTLLQYINGDNGESREVFCLYDSGLGLGSLNGFTERLGLRLITDPFWRDLVNQGTKFEGHVILNPTNRIIERAADFTWSNMDTGIAVGSALNVVYYDNNNILYAGGNFTQAGSPVVVYDDFAIWDDLAWDRGTATVTGGTGQIFAFSKDIVNNKLIVGGSFTSLNSVANTAGIGLWDDTTWTSIGGTGIVAGGGTVVNAIAVADNGDIFVGGDFDTLGGVANTENIGYWDESGSAWTAMEAAGVDEVVHSIVINGDTVTIGGEFANAGGSAAAEIVQYSRSANAFTAFTDQPNNTVRALVLVGNTITVGGDFTDIGGTTFKRIAQWTGSNWAQMADGFSDGTVRTLAVDPNNIIYAGGTFTTTGTAGVVLSNSAAFFVDGSWRPAEFSVVSTSQVDSLSISKTGKISVAFPGATTANVTATKSVTNRATAPCFPVIRIAHDGGADTSVYRVGSNTQNKHIYFNNLVLYSNEVITIDLRKAVKTFTSNLRGDMRRFVLSGSQHNTLSVLPGDNVLSAFTDNPTTAIVWYWDVNHTGID